MGVELDWCLHLKLPLLQTLLVLFEDVVHLAADGAHNLQNGSLMYLSTPMAGQGLR